jgi:hypothetical protein
MLGKILHQVEETAAAQAEMARVIAAGLKEVGRLADTLARPRTREGTVELPTGKVRMVIKETRQ